MIVAHIMGMPLEESVLQLVPTCAAMVTAVAIGGRTTLRRLRRRLPGGAFRTQTRRTMTQHRVDAAPD